MQWRSKKTATTIDINSRLPKRTNQAKRSKRSKRSKRNKQGWKVHEVQERFMDVYGIAVLKLLESGKKICPPQLATSIC
jgi:hypothetical protein